MFKFLKKHKMSTLLISIISFLFVGTIVASIAWYSLYLNIETPDVRSGIMSSYFDKRNDEDIALVDGDPAPYGSEGNPYVITRPVHFYNLARLQELNYESFSSGNLWFEFGKKNIDGKSESASDKLDDNVYQFYKYVDGEAVNGQYSRTLDMSYYTSANSNEIVPIGSCAVPFVSHIVGHNLTVDNLHIKGKGRADVGVFGYVGDFDTSNYSSLVSELYFDHLTIDLADVSETESSGANHTGHIEHVNVGYLAGHIKKQKTFNNVYVNNCSFTSTKALGNNIRCDFGYFGYCDEEGRPQTAENEHQYKFQPGDVHNYLTSNYSTIQNYALSTRDTGYDDSEKSVSDAISLNSSTYTFGGNTDANPQTTQALNEYSLATTGYREGNKTYATEYLKDGEYDYLEDVGVTPTPMDENDTPGNYIYYDTDDLDGDGVDNAWIYYNIATGGDGTTKVRFNMYTLSFKRDQADDDDPGGTMYLKYNNGTLVSTSDAPQAYATTPDYYFAFLTTPGTSGKNSFTYYKGGTFYIYSVANDEYMYVSDSDSADSATTVHFKFANYDTAIDGNDVLANRFTITGGKNGMITYKYDNSTTCTMTFNYAKQGGRDYDPLGRTSNGTYPPLLISLSGSSTANSTEDGVRLTPIDDEDDLADATQIAIGGTHQTSTYIMSNSQNKNNRGAFLADVEQDDSIIYCRGMALLDIVRRGSYQDSTGYYSLEDKNTIIGNSQYNEGTFLTYTEVEINGRNANNLITQTYTTDDEEDDESYQWWMLDFSSNSKGPIYNDKTQSAAISFSGANKIFAGVQSLGSSFASTTVYRADDDVVPTKVISPFVSPEMSISGGGLIKRNPYPIYYSTINDPTTRQLLTAAPSFVVSFFVESEISKVTIKPHNYNGWTLCTRSSDLIVGETYLLAANTATTGGASGVTAAGYNSNKFGYVATTFENDKKNISTAGTGTIEFVLGGSSGNYTLSCMDFGMLSISPDADSINFSGTGDSTLAITIATGVTTIKSEQTTTNRSLKYNPDGYFTNLDSGTNVQLYRKTSNNPQYIGDKIGNGYSPAFIDAVGNVSYTSTEMTMSKSSETIPSPTLSTTFRNIVAQGSMVFRVPNRGSLDFGTITIRYTGSAPVFLKGNGTAVTFDSVGCTATETDDVYEYELSLNKFNIFGLSYCLAASETHSVKAIYGTDGVATSGSGNLATGDEFILVVGSDSSSVSVTYAELFLPRIVGNVGDFGKVGFRSATYTGDYVNTVTATSVVKYEEMSYTFDLPNTATSLSLSVAYATSTGYAITFSTNVTTDFYLYNFNAEAAKVKFNNSNKYKSFETITFTP